MRRLRLASFVSLAWLLLAAGSAHAAPVTLDFDTGASLEERVTNQYGPPGTPAGPTFKKSSEDGLGGIDCGPPKLVDTYPAHSGSNELELDGCENGEFWPSDTFFTLGYTSERVEFWVASDTPKASTTVTSTAFNAKGERGEQVETAIAASSEAHYVLIALESAKGEIASVAIQQGVNFHGNPGSSTEVTEGAGGTNLLLDDLTYYPPASPPESSFRLGANPSAVATTQGNTVEVKVPVVWSNNPDPSASPVQFEAQTPEGVEATFSPNPSSTSTTTMTLTIAKDAQPGQTAVTVMGYVEKGKASEKRASVEIPLGISSALEPSGAEPLTLAPCTPRQLTAHVRTPSYVKEPVTIELIDGNQPGARISAISGGGELVGPNAARASVTPTPVTGGNEATVTFTLTVAPGAEPTAPAGYAIATYAANYPEVISYGQVSIEAGAVNKVTNGGGIVPVTTVATPALHKPGTQVQLSGAGFCPGAKVAIGDSLEGEGTEDQAIPESISPNGNSLTFRVPRGAVSGSIQVVPASGSRFLGPSLSVSSFRNTFGFKWPNGDYGLLLDDELGDELFGKEETNFEPLPGWLVRKPEAVLFESMTNKHIPAGLCFGIAYSSLELDEFAGEASRFPSEGGDYPWDLEGEGRPSEPLLRFVTERFSLQFTDQLIPAEVNAVLGIHGTNDDIDAIEEELAAGHPVMIGMIHWHGASIEGHTVLAYDSRPLPGGGTAVYVSNSNEPYSTEEQGNGEVHNARQFKNSELIVKEGNWEFPEGADFSGSEGKPWTGSEADLVVYHHHELPIINGERPHLPNLLTSTVMAVFGSAGDGVTQLSDGHGSLFSGGQLAPQSSWPTGVAPVPAFTSKGGPLQLVSFDPKTAKPLTATVARTAGGGAMNLQLPGLQASLQAGVHAGQIDRVSIDPASDAIGYQSTTSSTPLSGTLLSAPGVATGASAKAAATATATSTLSDRIAQFATTSSKGGKDTLSFPQGRAFVLQHSGAPTSLSLTLSAFAADGQPVEIQVPTIGLAAGASVQVRPGNWRALGSTAIRVSTTVHGHTRVRMLHGRVLGRRFASVRKATLTELGGHRYRLDVLLGVHGTPKGASLSLAASLSSHGRTVARAAGNQLSGDALRGGKLQLVLRGTLAAGRYTLKLRLLEITASGAVQGSVVLAKTLTVQAR
jgi:hypothetical protein